MLLFVCAAAQKAAAQRLRSRRTAAWLVFRPNVRTSRCIVRVNRPRLLPGCRRDVGGSTIGLPSVVAQCYRIRCFAARRYGYVGWNSYPSQL